MEAYNFISPQLGQPFLRQPVLEGANALFSDLGSNCRHLDLDFAAEDILFGGNLTASQDAWQRQAAITNIAAHGAAIQSGATGAPEAAMHLAWKPWAPMEENPMDLERSSGDSQVPSSSDFIHDSPAAMPTVDASEAPKPTNVSARRSAQLQKEREKAERLKEKNKRAQRKFRQRQKDRQETAEKLASNLADQLAAMRLEKQALEQKNKVLEDALHSKANSPAENKTDAPLQEAEPVFTPARDWDSFSPKGGMVLIAICNPPRKFTHKQMMSLSLRDLSKIMNELVRLLKESLTALEQNPPNLAAEARIQALLLERHAVMAYLAMHAPLKIYRILTSKMVDPPEPDCPPPPTALWAEILTKLDLADEQRRNIMDARTNYIRRIGHLVFERHELRKKILKLELIPSGKAPIRPNASHLQWSDLVEKLKENLEACHRLNSYFMTRVWYRDCFLPRQVARIIVEAHPFQVDIFGILRELAGQLGEPHYKEVLRRECGTGECEDSSLDSAVDEDFWHSAEGDEALGGKKPEESAPDREMLANLEEIRPYGIGIGIDKL